MFVSRAVRWQPGCSGSARKIEDRIKGDRSAGEKAVKAVLDDYVKSIDDEDMDLCARVMSNDSDMVDVGGAEGPFDGTLLRIESAD